MRKTLLLVPAIALAIGTRAQADKQPHISDLLHAQSMSIGCKDKGDFARMSALVLANGENKLSKAEKEEAIDFVAKHCRTFLERTTVLVLEIDQIDPDTTIICVQPQGQADCHWMSTYDIEELGPF